MSPQSALDLSCMRVSVITHTHSALPEAASRGLTAVGIGSQATGCVWSSHSSTRGPEVQLNPQELCRHKPSAFRSPLLAIAKTMRWLSNDRLNRPVTRQAQDTQAQAHTGSDLLHCCCADGVQLLVSKQAASKDGTNTEPAVWALPFLHLCRPVCVMKTLGRLNVCLSTTPSPKHRLRTSIQKKRFPNAVNLSTHCLLNVNVSYKHRSLKSTIVEPRGFGVG